MGGGKKVDSVGGKKLDSVVISFHVVDLVTS